MGEKQNKTNPTNSLDFPARRLMYVRVVVGGRSRNGMSHPAKKKNYSIFNGVQDFS